MDSATKIAELKKQIAELNKQIAYEERHEAVKAIIADILTGLKYEVERDDREHPDVRVFIKTHIHDKCRTYCDMIDEKEREIGRAIHKQFPYTFRCVSCHSEYYY